MLSAISSEHDDAWKLLRLAVSKTLEHEWKLFSLNPLAQLEFLTHRRENNAFARRNLLSRSLTQIWSRISQSHCGHIKRRGKHCFAACQNAKQYLPRALGSTKAPRMMTPGSFCVWLYQKRQSMTGNCSFRSEANHPIEEF